MLLAAPRPPIEMEMRSLSLRLKSTGLPGRCGEAFAAEAEPPAAFAFARLPCQRGRGIRDEPRPLLQRDLEVECIAPLRKALDCQLELRQRRTSPRKAR